MFNKFKLPLLLKLLAQKKFKFRNKILSCNIGYTSNSKTYGYIQLVKQSILTKHLLSSQKSFNLQNKKLLQPEEKKRNIFSFIFGAIIVIIRIFIITCVATGLFIIYCFHRTFHFEGFPEACLQGIEFLGPTFIKFGQWMSTRRDLFSEEFCSTLSRLQQNTSAHSWFYTRHVLKQIYGPKWNEIFGEFDRVPVGSGCCAQVYRATILIDAKDNYVNQNAKFSIFVDIAEYLYLGHLIDFLSGNLRKCNNDSSCNSKLVAVKILHPRIQEMIRRDLSVLRFISKCITYVAPSLEWLSIDGCMDEFSQMMENQVDLNIEAKNLDRFSKNFSKMSDVCFPRPYFNLSNKEILVETFHYGRPINEYLKEKSEDFRRKLAALGLNTIFKMIFEDNFVHSDLHPGNILVQEKFEMMFFEFPKVSRTPRIVILDCGLVAELDEVARKNFRCVFKSVAERDGRKAADFLMHHSLFKSQNNFEIPDPEGFRVTMQDIVDRYLKSEVRLQDVNVGHVISELFSAMINYKVKQDAVFSNIILSIAVIEGLGRSLDSGIDILSVLSPYVLYDPISNLFR